MPNRSGRFQGEVGLNSSSMIQKIPIVQKRKSQLYRIFNPPERLSGATTHDFRVEYGNSEVVARGSSLDFLAAEDAAQAIEIAHPDDTPTDEKTVRGLYEYLSNTRSSRDGRFRFNDTVAHKVIDFSANLSAGISASYRFLNSGDHPFQIWLDDGTNVTRIAIVQKKRSFDIHVPVGSRIAVRAGTTTPIEGIFELLGIES